MRQLFFIFLQKRKKERKKGGEVKISWKKKEIEKYRKSIKSEVKNKQLCPGFEPSLIIPFPMKITVILNNFVFLLKRVVYFVDFSRISVTCRDKVVGLKKQSDIL